MSKLSKIKKWLKWLWTLEEREYQKKSQKESQKEVFIPSPACDMAFEVAIAKVQEEILKEDKLEQERRDRLERERARRVAEEAERRRKRREHNEYIERSIRIKEEKERAEWLRKNKELNERRDKLDSWEDMMEEFDRVEARKRNNQYTYNNRQKKRYRGSLTQDVTSAYTTLESSPTDTFKQIRKKYLMLCKMYHPDTYINQEIDGNQSKEDKMKRVNEAFDIIKKHLGK